MRIINCARGGLIVEEALKAALEAGHVAGAAIDVYRHRNRLTENPLFGMDNVICTPHLGAATEEAQENVAIQVAEQMSDYLLTGAVTNALNMPSISAEEAPRLKPFVALAEQLGSFAGQLTESGITGLSASSMQARSATMNKQGSDLGAAGRSVPADAGGGQYGVSAPVMARERGINHR